MPISKFGLIAVMASLFLAWGAAAAAASCVEPLPIDQEIDAAGTVFVGTVTALEYEGRVARFSVEEVWKGEVASTVTVTGGPTLDQLEQEQASGASIVTSVDRSFEMGVRYLVVPYGMEEGLYLDNGCSATQPFDSSLEQLRPESVQPPTEVGADEAVLSARVALAVVAGAGVGAFLITRMRRRGLTPAGSD